MYEADVAGRDQDQAFEQDPVQSTWPALPDRPPPRELLSKDRQDEIARKLYMFEEAP
jgi:hypothetical protein